ncbi:MAG: hypothetical protein R3C17_04465 [Planctomycetaceae bacterium]
MNKVPKSKGEVIRRIASGGLLTAIALSNFSKADNHWAEICGWTLFASGALAVAERKQLSDAEFQRSIDLACRFIMSSLQRLCDELKARTTLLEGNCFYDAPYRVLNVRITYLCGLMAWFWLWRRQEGILKDATDNFIISFVRDNKIKPYLWGEGAVPFFLAVFYLLRMTDATKNPDEFLASMLRQVVRQNPSRSPIPLAQPFISAEEVLARNFGVSDEVMPLGAQGSSYTAETLLHCLVRRNRKQSVALLWPEFSKICSQEFIPDTGWELLRWRNLESGAISTKCHPPREKLGRLKTGIERNQHRSSRPPQATRLVHSVIYDGPATPPVPFDWFSHRQLLVKNR